MTFQSQWCAWDQQPLCAAAGEVDAWLLDTRQCSGISDTDLRGLSHWERNRARRFIFQSEAHRFAIGQLRLRTLLGRYGGDGPLRIGFQLSPSGQHLVKASGGIRLAISYAGPYVLYAVAREQSVGAGMSRVNAVDEPSLIAEALLTPNECWSLQRMSPVAQAQAFSQCWSRRSALLQAVKDLPLAALELPDLLAAGPIVSPVPSPCGDTSWTVADLPAAGNCVASIAVEGPLVRLSAWRLVDGGAAPRRTITCLPVAPSI